MRNSPKRFIDGVVIDGVVNDGVIVQQSMFCRQFQHRLGALVQNALMVAVPSELFSESKAINKANK